MPGFGSLAAGRKVGYVQAALGLLGLTLTAVFALRFFAWYIANRTELQADPADPLLPLLAIWQAARWSLAGIGVFALGWLWALVTSVQIVAGAKDPPALNVPPKL